MVGHSNWSKVKRIKGPPDVRRGAAFSKLVKEVTFAARIGGGDLSGVRRHAGAPLLKFHAAIEDTQNVYANFNVPEDILARLHA